MKEQLINETEFGFRQVDERTNDPRVTSRRPVGLLSNEQMTRLSARSDFIPMIYVLSHYGLIVFSDGSLGLCFQVIGVCLPFLLRQLLLDFCFRPYMSVLMGRHLRVVGSMRASYG